MSKVLKQLLENDHPLFLMNVALLERATGSIGIDAKLVGDITSHGHEMLHQLGLDPSDTTDKELYQSLLARFRQNRNELKQLLSSTSYVLVNLGVKPISLNFRDIEDNARDGSSYEDSSVAHAQRQLRAELVRRYAEYERTHTDIVYNLAKEVNVLIDGENFSAMPVPESFKSQMPAADDGPPPDKQERPATTRQRSAAPVAHAADYHKTVFSNLSSKKENEEMDEKPKVLAVGDIISNAFIKLTEDFFKVTKDEEGHEWLSMELGGKLSYDHVDIVKVSECSPNAAVSLARLGLDSHLMTWVGGDEVGQEMLEFLDGEGVNTSTTSIQEGKKSSYHYVLRYGADRTKLQRFEDYDYQWQDPEVKPDWLYLGVLGENTWDFHLAILDYLKRNPEIKLAFQPGMYHLMWGAEKLAEFYEHAEIVIMNREEAAQVTGKSRIDIKELLAGLHELGVSIAVVTDGPAGAYASNQEEQLFMPNYPDPAPPFERTGAGDAFASTLVAALATGQPLSEALRWAPINSAYVVQQIGAQAGLLTREELMGHLENAPEDYHTKSLEEHLAEQ